MSDLKNDTRLPELRFPEFEHRKGFKRTPLSKLLVETKTRNKDNRFGKEHVLSVSGEFGCVNQIELLGRSYAGVSVDNYHTVEPGDLVYTKSPLKRNPYGIIKENKGSPGIVSTLYAVYRTTERAAPAYLDYFFCNDYNLNVYLQPLVNKGAKNDMKVKNSNVLTGHIFVPELDEQEKISDALSSIDELIKVEFQKLRALSDHKTGWMQKLLPLDGQEMPEVRLPEFRSAAKWGRKKIEDFGKIFKGKGVSKSDIAENGATPCIRYGQLYTDYGEVIHEVISSTNVRREELFLSKKNDVLVPASGETQEDIATASCVLDDNVALGGDINVLRTSAVGEFLSYYINVSLKDTISKVSQGISVVHLYPSQIEQLEFILPNEDEQRGIVAFLSQLDALCLAQSNKLEEIKELKKGLIQRLFVPPEVRGE